MRGYIHSELNGSLQVQNDDILPIQITLQLQAGGRGLGDHPTQAALQGFYFGKNDISIH